MKVFKYDQLLVAGSSAADQPIAASELHRPYSSESNPERNPNVQIPGRDPAPRSGLNKSAIPVPNEGVVGARGAGKSVVATATEWQLFASSSSASGQSFFPSHSRVASRQVPSEQENCPGKHVTVPPPTQHHSTSQEKQHGRTRFKTTG